MSENQINKDNKAADKFDCFTQLIPVHDARLCYFGHVAQLDSAEDNWLNVTTYKRPGSKSFAL